MQKPPIRHPGLPAANCLIMLHHALILLLLGPMVPEIMKTFGIGEAKTGILLSAGALGPILGGVLIDRRIRSGRNGFLSWSS